MTTADVRGCPNHCPSSKDFMVIFGFYNKLSRGEICVANFIPPCEWCESGVKHGLKIALNVQKIVIVLLFAFMCSPAKRAKILHFVLIFVFVRGEVKNLRKTVFGVCARCKKYR